MKSASPLVAVLATALLHAAVIAAAVIGLASRQKTIVPPKPIAVQLLRERASPPAPLPVARVEPQPPQPPRKNPPQARPHPAPKPPPQPREPVAPQVNAPAVPFAPAPAGSNTSAVQAPATQAPPAPAPAAPVKTGVSISASYKAANRKPPYPRLSRQNDEQGVVQLRVFVQADGTAGKVELAATSGYPLLDESARNTVQTWRFNPATVDGKPVGEWYRLSVPFTLND